MQVYNAQSHAQVCMYVQERAAVSQLVNHVILYREWQRTSYIWLESLLLD